MSDLRFENPLDGLAAAARPSAAVTLRLDGPKARLNFRARDEGTIARAGEAFGVALPREACRFVENGLRRALWLGPDEWLLTAPAAEGTAIASAMGKALAGMAHSLVDISHRSVSFIVSGPQAATALNAGCPLDLGPEAFPVGMGTRTVLAKTEITLLRTGEAGFEVDVWRSFAPYAFTFLEEARREFA